jgi:hypothetical protein
MDDDYDWSEIESLMQERDEWKYRAQTASDYVAVLEAVLLDFAVRRKNESPSSL